jgi:alkyldihydroxyacetonephosphate synthase
MRKRSFWGWGYEDEGPDPRQLRIAQQGVGGMLGMADVERAATPSLAAIELPAPRTAPPASLAAICSTEPYDRAGHTYGKSYRDVVRGVARDFSPAPDYVAFPETESQVVQILDSCASNNIAAIPYGGGSSVCGGTEAAVGDGFDGAVSIDLTRLNRVQEIDATSRAARIQAGALGPVLEDQLRPSGFTLRHFPQSFEFSTLGGWIATRSGGHFATLYTHIEDLVESMRIVTPAGIIETRRLPGSGAGPSPDRLFAGSEGILGIITEAWMRVQVRPTFRAQATVLFEDFFDGARAVKAISQAGLYPANCRLLDPLEAMLNGAGTGKAVLIIAFESADHPLDAWLNRAIECARDHGGEVSDAADEPSATTTAGKSGASSTERRGDDDSAGAWKRSFLRAPYLRDELVLMGVFTETFETAVTWDRFEALHTAVTAAARVALRETGGDGIVTCRFTHAYPDGVAPYFTVVAPAVRGDELAQWDVIKTAITTAMLENGGTTTHHHAVGRDFRPFYDRQRPDGFALALSGAKSALDPAGIMNPGVLLPV